MNCDELQHGDLLERYLDGDLDTPARDGVEAHYFECAPCFERLQTVRAVREEFGRSRWRGGARQAAVAASVLLVAGALGTGIVILERENRDLEQRLARAAVSQTQIERQTSEITALRDRLASLSQPQLNAPIIDLEPHAAVRGRDSAVRTVEVTEEVRLMTFVLTADEAIGGPPYVVALLDADGRVLWEAAGLRKSRFGTFTVTIPALVLPTGPVSLRVRGTDAGRSLSAHDYQFRVVRR